MKSMEDEIKKCVKILLGGGTILYPTDTIWGIGCDATNVKAVSKIFKLKRREENKSLIVLMDEYERLHQHVEKLPEVALDLIDAIDKPVTVIYSKGKNLAKNVLANDGSIGIRIVKNDFCINLIKALGRPIVSTSANIAGETSPLRFSDISDEIKNGVDLVVDPSFGTLTEPHPSRIIKLEDNGMFSIIRD